MGVRFPLPAPSSLKWLSKRELTEFDVAEGLTSPTSYLFPYADYAKLR